MGIACEENNDPNLTNIFTNLEQYLLYEKERHFRYFSLKNSTINEIYENVFKAITFDAIHIEYCNNLTKINENAFTGTESKTKLITISHNPLLTFGNNSIFDILNKFTNLKIAEIIGNKKVTEIPSNAFTSLNKLWFLRFEDSFTKIGSYAFSKLKNLREIWLKNDYFDEISEHILAFDNPSNISLSIKFVFNSSHINGSGLNEKSLLNTNRPTELRFSNIFLAEDEQYLDERVFQPFLMDNPRNTIDVEFRDFDCNNVRNSWIKNNNQINERVIIRVYPQFAQTYKCAG